MRAICPKCGGTGASRYVIAGRECDDAFHRAGRTEELSPSCAPSPSGAIEAAIDEFASKAGVFGQTYIERAESSLYAFARGDVLAAIEAHVISAAAVATQPLRELYELAKTDRDGLASKLADCGIDLKDARVAMKAKDDEIARLRAHAAHRENSWRQRAEAINRLKERARMSKLVVRDQGHTIATVTADRDRLLGEVAAAQTECESLGADLLDDAAEATQLEAERDEAKKTLAMFERWADMKQREGDGFAEADAETREARATAEFELSQDAWHSLRAYRAAR